MRSSGVSFALWLALASAPFVSAKLGLNYGRVDAVGEALVRPCVRESVVSVGWVVVGLQFTGTTAATQPENPDLSLAPTVALLRRQKAPWPRRGKTRSRL